MGFCADPVAIIWHPNWRVYCLFGHVLNTINSFGRIEGIAEFGDLLSGGPAAICF